MSTLHQVSVSANCIGSALVVKHLGLNVEFKEVDFDPAKGLDTKTDAFLKMNPMHCIPTYQDKEGWSMWESNAIVKVLCAGSDLVPVKDRAVEARAALAADFKACTLYPRLGKLAYPFYGFAAPADDVAAATQQAEEALAVLDTWFLKEASFVAGTQLTYADFNIYATVLFAKLAGVAIPEGVDSYLTRFESAVPIAQEVTAPLRGFAASKK